MKQLRKLTDFVKKISLVDKFLMLFMLALLFYTAYNLFTRATVSEDTNTIDVIVRTAAAGIFGYFVSGNFAKAHSAAPTQSLRISPQSVSTQGSTDISENKIRNQIGFAATDSAKTEPETPSPSATSSAALPFREKIQVITVSVIGLSALVLLFIARNFVNMTPEIAATVSQMRDFVSASVGFLISCGKGTPGLSTSE